MKIAVIGFRPLTGILFFNSEGGCALIYNIDMFPSPYGDFVFQHLHCQGKDEWNDTSFRPLTGILFFNPSLRKALSFLA